jgi:hypothetical protein
MDEAERVIARKERFVRSDEVPAGEREQAGGNSVSLCFGEQSGDGTAVKQPPFDGAAG